MSEKKTLTKASRETQPIRCTIGPVSIDGVRIVDGDAWLTRKQLADLFEVTTQAIDYQITKVRRESPTGMATKNFLVPINAGKAGVRDKEIEHYNTRFVMHVGYGINGDRGLAFREWTTSVLHGEVTPLLGPVPPLLREMVRQEQADEYGIMWPQDFAEHICKLYRKPYNGRQPRFMASIYRRLYDCVAGSPAMQEIKRRNPEPRYGRNHHQWFTPRARDAMSRQVGVITTLAKQSGTAGEFWNRVHYEYLSQPLQLGFR